MTDCFTDVDFDPIIIARPAANLPFVPDDAFRQSIYFGKRERQFGFRQMTVAALALHAPPPEPPAAFSTGGGAAEAKEEELSLLFGATHRVYTIIRSSPCLASGGAPLTRNWLTYPP